MSTRHNNFNWVLEPWKFLSEEEAKTLLAAAREGASLAATQGRKTPVRDYLIVDIQDVFAAAMLQGPPPRQPRAYLFRIAKRQLLAHERRKRQEMMSKIIVSAHVDVRIVNETTQDRCASEPPEQVLMNERTEIIAALIDRLPPASKEALCLRILDDLSMEAAALEARCSKQTLRKRLQRARQSLLRSLRRLGL